MTDTTDRAPWCPMTGHPMVHRVSATDFEGSRNGWMVGCEDCGFGTEPRQPIQPARKSAETIARRLIRAELARQALEMRAHSFALDPHYNAGGKHGSLEFNLACAMHDYEWLGTHPLRLPGEGA